ncbi:MAG: Transcription initiation factor TFIID subunit 12 [Chrysothrix sp. TS-e1954]|nr:MAG: Transcription initiation factor TFIID subunit 12 [Chrysothrix sp. TS-e1954]
MSANTVASQGQGQVQGQGQGQGQGQDPSWLKAPPYSQFIREQAIKGLPFLTDERKVEMVRGTGRLWEAIRTKPRNDTQHMQAVQKLRDITHSMMTQLKRYRDEQAAKAGGAGAPQQPTQAAAPSKPQQGQAQPEAQQSANPPQQQQQQPQPQQPPQPRPQGAPQQLSQPEVPDVYRQKAESIPWAIPPAHQNNPSYLPELKRRYAQQSYLQQLAKNEITRVDVQISQLRENGRDIPPELMQRRDNAQKQGITAQNFIGNIQQQQREIQGGGGGGGGGAQARMANPQQAAQNLQQQQQQQQQQARAANQPGANQTNPQQLRQPPVQAGNASLQQQATQQAQQSQQNRPGSSGAPPNSAGSNQQIPNFNANRMQANQTSGGAFTQSPQSTVGPAAQNIPTQQQQQQPQGPHSFTHSEAMKAAANTYSNGSNNPQQQQSNMQPQPSSQQQPSASQTPSSQPQSQQTNPPNPTVPANGTPSGSAPLVRPETGERVSASRGWPPPQPPKTPQPVQMGPSRPTLSGAANGPMGMMGQPALQQTPAFNLHGPGDRVLDKKKLDELVRQVTGGGDGGRDDAEGAAGSGGGALQPEVEESILSLADEFIDNVVTSACKLAKLRNAPVLDIRDIQLVLERTYNIRVPGYATDEVRTVRKTGPTPAYLQKMNAVNGAKVMGGAGGREGV